MPGSLIRLVTLNALNGRKMWSPQNRQNPHMTLASLISDVICGFYLSIFMTDIFLTLSASVVTNLNKVPWYNCFSCLGNNSMYLKIISIVNSFLLIKKKLISIVPSFLLIKKKTNKTLVYAYTASVQMENRIQFNVQLGSDFIVINTQQQQLKVRNIYV